jgi:hypothetical protein
MEIHAAILSWASSKCTRIEEGTYAVVSNVRRLERLFDEFI